MQANLIISILLISERLYQYNRPVLERNQEFLRRTFRKYGRWDIMSYIGWRGKIKFALYAISPQLFLYVKSCYEKVKKL